jgi:chromosome segregation ATPase
MDKINLPARMPSQAVDTTQVSGQLDTIRGEISQCIGALRSISASATSIAGQGFLEHLFADNETRLAEHVRDVTTVQQRMLDLTLLLMAGQGRLKHKYDEIIQAIDEAKELHSGNIPVIEFLVKVKRTVADIKAQADQVEALVRYTNELRDSLETLGKGMTDRTAEILKTLERSENAQEGLSARIAALSNSLVEGNASWAKKLNSLHASMMMRIDDLTRKEAIGQKTILGHQNQLRYLWASVALSLMVALATVFFAFK